MKQHPIGRKPTVRIHKQELIELTVRSNVNRSGLAWHYGFDRSQLSQLIHGIARLTAVTRRKLLERWQWLGLHLTFDDPFVTVGYEERRARL